MIGNMTALTSAMLLSMVIVACGPSAFADQAEVRASDISPASATPPAGHAPMTALQGSALKLGRGLANLCVGWIEFPKQIYVIGQREGWVRGLLRGPIDGFGMLLARSVAGAYEVLTFPVPIPPQYQPLIRPHYVWQVEPGPEKR